MFVCLTWTIFKVFIDFVTVLLLFYILVSWPGGRWDFGSLTRDQTHAPCSGTQKPNHWTIRAVPREYLFLSGRASEYSTNTVGLRRTSVAGVRNKGVPWRGRGVNKSLGQVGGGVGGGGVGGGRGCVKNGYTL